MKIFLNDREIDFELKGEKTLGQVLASLKTWVQKQKYFLGEVRVNHEIIDIESKVIEKRLLSEVTTLHCTVLSAVAYAVSVWSELSLHFKPFKLITSESVIENMEDISGRLEWIKKIIAKLDNFFDTPKENQPLIQNVKALEVMLFQLKTQPEKIEKIKNLLELIDRDLEQGLFKLNLKILKSGLKEDLSSVRNSLENYSVFLELLEEKLLMTATAFQKSHLKSALEDIPLIVEGLSVYYILEQQLDQLSDNYHSIKEMEKASRNKLAESLKGFLHGMEESIKNQDYIDTADIIEYEVKEMLPAIKEVLENICCEIDQTQTDQVVGATD